MAKNIFLIIAVLIIASFFRFYNLSTMPPGLYPDEAMNGNNALQALRTAPPAGGFKVFYPENNGREGLFINIQAIFLKFLMPASGGNPEPWMLRIVSALFGILTVLGIYFLARELFGNDKSKNRNQEEEIPSHNSSFIIHNSEKIALLSSFLLATSFWHINFSRIGFRAIMAPFFLTWALYLLIKSLNQIKNKFQAPSTKFQINSNGQNSNNQNRFRILNFKNWNLFGIWNSGFGIWAILAGLLYGLGFYSYIAYRTTPILILIVLLFYWFKNKEKGVRKKILISASGFLALTFLTVLPLGLYFLQNPQDFFGRTSQISIFNSPTPLKNLGSNILKTAGMFNFSGDYNWRHNIAGRPLLFWPVGILFLIGIILGILNFLKAPNHKHQITNNIQNSNDQNSKRFGIWDLGFVILFSWIIIAALPIVISNEGLPHALRAILMIPPVFILAAIGGFWFYKFLKTKIRPATLKVFIIIFFGFLIFETLNTYFILWAKNPNVYNAFSSNYVELARKLNELPKELPKYVIVEAGGMTVPMKSAFYADEDKIVNIPMPAQTIMFITDTFDFQKQKEKNIFYVLPDKINQIPKNSFTVELK